MRTGALLAMILGAVRLCAGEDAGLPGVLHGNGILPRVAGAAVGDIPLYEFNLFVSPVAGGTPIRCRRLGAPPGEPARGDGSYRIGGLPPGRYSLYLNQPDFFASPAVIPEVIVPPGGEVRADIGPAADAAAFCGDGGQWTEWDTVWFQTFRAVGTAVRGVSWKMAGWGLYAGKSTRVAVLRDNGDPDVRRWPVLGTATDPRVASDADEWVRWRSGEIPLVPGERYAVRLETLGGMAVYKRPKDDATRAAGRAYGSDGLPRDFDLHVCVFSDRGTRVTRTNLRPGPGVFVPKLHDVRWGQTFVATGRALAAADLFAAVSDPDAVLRWQVRSDGPDGPAVGPEKEGAGAYFASTTKLFAVSFSPAEVPLVPGRTYCIDVRGEEGFTPFLRHPEEASPGGSAFRAGRLAPGELSMTIVEYDTSGAGPGE